MAKQNVLKRFSKVNVVACEAKVINPVFEREYDKEGFPKEGSEFLWGYRLTDGRRPASWFVVPAYMVEGVSNGKAGE